MVACLWQAMDSSLNGSLPVCARRCSDAMSLSCARSHSQHRQTLPAHQASQSDRRPGSAAWCIGPPAPCNHRRRTLPVQLRRAVVRAFRLRQCPRGRETSVGHRRMRSTGHSALQALPRTCSSRVHSFSQLWLRSIFRCVPP